MTIYKAGVIGAGSGGRLSMKALEASDRYQLDAVCDVNPDVCRESSSQFGSAKLRTAA